VGTGTIAGVAALAVALLVIGIPAGLLLGARPATCRPLTGRA